jgi:hypothetical protein
MGLFLCPSDLYLTISFPVFHEAFLILCLFIHRRLLLKRYADAVAQSCALPISFRVLMPTPLLLTSLYVLPMCGCGIKAHTLYISASSSRLHFFFIVMSLQRFSRFTLRGGPWAILSGAGRVSQI